MLFNSFVFILFNFLSLALYWAVRGKRFKHLVLVLSSFVFYAWSFWPALILFLCMLVFNYFAGLFVGKSRSKVLLFFVVSVNLLVLGLFKYSAFFLQTLETVLSCLNLHYSVPEVQFWLSLGISFYTFQMIAYLVDVYRGEIESEKDFFVFLVFKSFYAQLVAGPIVRASEILPQIHSVDKIRFKPEVFQRGLYFLTAGLFLKIVIADTLAQFVDFAFLNSNAIDFYSSWVGLFGFSVQILADFWGYSTIAVGVALLYGFQIPYNFKNPYAASSAGEFWRTWHISLSNWLRDYLYFPLGGGRSRRYRNILITLTLAGLWHGASWNFIIYGFCHGFWLCLEKFCIKNDFSINIPRLMKQVFVFTGLSLLRVFFRTESLSDAFVYFRSLCGEFIGAETVPKESVYLILSFFLFNHFFEKSLRSDEFSTWKLSKQILITLFMVLCISSFAESRFDFIYFEF